MATPSFSVRDTTPSTPASDMSSQVSKSLKISKSSEDISQVPTSAPTKGTASRSNTLTNRPAPLKGTKSEKSSNDSSHFPTLVPMTGTPVTSDISENEHSSRIFLTDSLNGMVGVESIGNSNAVLIAGTSTSANSANEDASHNIALD